MESIILPENEEFKYKKKFHKSESQKNFCEKAKEHIKNSLISNNNNNLHNKDSEIKGENMIQDFFICPFIKCGKIECGFTTKEKLKKLELQKIFCYHCNNYYKFIFCLHCQKKIYFLFEEEF